MKVKSFILVISIVMIFFQGCKNTSDEKVTINGSFAGLPSSKFYIYQLLPASKPMIDSVSTNGSGVFRISFKVKKSGYYSLLRSTGDEIILVVSPGEKITLTGNGSPLSNSYTVEGSKDSKLYAEYTEFTNKNLQKVDSLSRIFAESRTNPDFIRVKQQLDAAYIAIFNNQKEKVASFVNNNPNSLASLLVISNNFGPNPLLTEKSHPRLFLKLDSALFLTYPENSLVNTFHLRMLDFKAEMADAQEHDKNLKPGMKAPEIALPDPAGKKIKLSSLRGKLTLVYFWSSWNALSRQTNMNLSSIYNKYHKLGFEIYAVSIDSDADLWKKSYLLDKAYWIHVNDPKGLESEFCKTYAVRAIPGMILIGKDGNIIARDPVFGELDGLIRGNL